MSKNVYVGSVSFEYVNIYSIGINIPNLYDFPNYHRNRLMFLGDRENEELKEKHKKLGDYGITIADLNNQFDKYEVLPDSLWIESIEKPLPKNEEYIFKVLIGGIILRGACAKILQNFKLGQTTITPLKIYEYETGKLWSDEVFYFLNLCEKRNYVCYPQSDGVFVYIQGAKRYSTRGVPINNEMLEIDRSALVCDVDLWHDPMLGGSIFMSEKLHGALKDANVVYQWNMKSCKFV